MNRIRVAIINIPTVTSPILFYSFFDDVAPPKKREERAPWHGWSHCARTAEDRGSQAKPKSQLTKQSYVPRLSQYVWARPLCPQSVCAEHPTPIPPSLVGTGTGDGVRGLVAVGLVESVVVGSAEGAPEGAPDGLPEGTSCAREQV